MTGDYGSTHPGNWVNPVSGRTYAGGTENQDITRDYPASDLIGRRPVTNALNPAQFPTPQPAGDPVLASIDNANRAIQQVRQNVRGGRTRVNQSAAQAAQALTAQVRTGQNQRNAAFAGMLAEARQTAIPQAAPAPAPAAPPTAPPAPPGTPPGGAGGLSSGPFGPGHPFYATLTPPKPTSYPTVGRPTMPTQAPTAGLDLAPKFLATPGGKLLTSAATGAVGAIGKALTEAVKPRPSMPDGLNTGPGWRTN